MTGDVYYWVVSLHGLAMLLLFAVQAVSLSTWPCRSLSARRISIGLINALSFWICFSFDVVGASLRPSRRWAWLDYISAVFNAVLAVAGRRLCTYGDCRRRHLLYSLVNFILTVTRLRRLEKMLDMSRGAYWPCLY
jgi:heme/copper-type cytochrome/quinol oxidase subunit 1